jgi:hypothetical protein
MVMTVFLGRLTARAVEFCPTHHVTTFCSLRLSFSFVVVSFASCHHYSRELVLCTLDNAKVRDPVGHVVVSSSWYNKLPGCAGVECNIWTPVFYFIFRQIANKYFHFLHRKRQRTARISSD